MSFIYFKKFLNAHKCVCVFNLNLIGASGMEKLEAIC